jgi:hypothetical protein
MRYRLQKLQEAKKQNEKFDERNIVASAIVLPSLSLLTVVTKVEEPAYFGLRVINSINCYNVYCCGVI